VRGISTITGKSQAACMFAMCRKVFYLQACLKIVITA